MCGCGCHYNTLENAYGCSCKGCPVRATQEYIAHRRYVLGNDETPSRPTNPGG